MTLVLVLRLLLLQGIDLVLVLRRQHLQQDMTLVLVLRLLLLQGIDLVLVLRHQHLQQDMALVLVFHRLLLPEEPWIIETCTEHFLGQKAGSLILPICQT